MERGIPPDLGRRWHPRRTDAVSGTQRECGRNRVIPFGERHLRRTIAEFVARYRDECTIKAWATRLIEGAPAAKEHVGRIRRRQQRLSAQGDYQAARAAFVARQPIGRIGTPEEIADLAVYLAGATYTTGHAHIIDGGWAI